MATAPTPETPENGSDAKPPEKPSRYDWQMPSQRRLKVGRGNKWEPTDRERLEAAIAFASGHSQQAVAAYFGVGTGTVVRHFAEEFKLAGEMSKLALRQRLWHKAMVEGDTAALIFLSKNMLGMSDRRDVNHTGELPVQREELCLRVVYEAPTDPRANPGPPQHLLPAPEPKED